MESIKTNRRNNLNLIRTLLSSLTKQSYNDVINDFLASRHDNFLFSQYFFAALDIISSHVWNPPEVTISKLPSKFRLNVNFCNKGMDFINLSQILNSPELIKHLPTAFNKNSPMVVFDLTKSIRSKIFNHKKTIQELDVDAFLADPSIFPCSCNDSPFKDNHHGHIISGDLRIVENNKLRKLLTKGPKFRESEPICWCSVKECVLTGVNESIKKWSDSLGLQMSLFSDWKCKVSECLNDKIDSLKSRIRPRVGAKALNDNSVKNYLNSLQERFVMVPIDKADSNVAFICKRHYIEVLVNELGLKGGANGTYQHLSGTNTDEVISTHKQELQDQFDIPLSTEMHSLPDIYWIPKLHKTPSKSRFIIASKQCSMKQLSKDVTSIFKLAYNQIERYNHKANTFSGIKTFWVIQNSKPVLATLHNVSNKNNAKTVSSYDFSTLYTKIPHSKLFDELSSIIHFIFKGGSKKCISISKVGVARWSNRISTSASCYDLQKTLKALRYLLDNCHFKFGNKLFRQTIGISMGSAPFFDILFLYCYESRWMTKMKKENNILARKFGRIFRYIDDLIAINDGNEFEKYHSEIYPDELELKKENSINTETTFLELNISIKERMFQTKLYDKRDTFGFHICRLPFRESNLPKRMFYSSASAEILRICRATSFHADAVSSAKSVVNRMLKQGASKHNLQIVIRKSLNKHQICSKFNSSTENFVNLIT